MQPIEYLSNRVFVSVYSSGFVRRYWSGPCTSLAWPDRLFFYRCMFCAENRQILAIVDWPLIGVNSLQRRLNDAFKLYKPPCTSFAWNIFEDC